jgi:hypothetical protein
MGPFFANSKKGGGGVPLPSVRNRHTAEADFGCSPENWKWTQRRFVGAEPPS